VSVRKDIETASDAEWAIASQRADVMDSLLSQSNAASVGEAARELGLSIAMMYRLLARYRKNPTPSSLLPAKAGVIVGATLLDSEVEGLVQRLIRSFYLIKERPRIADLHRHIAIECRRQNLKLPSYKAVWKRVHNLDPELVVRERAGARAARERFKSVSDGPRPKRPFELYQIDHTLADIIVVDELERKPIGRPWLTIVIDVATRMIAGFHLSLDAPSSTSVALAISNAVLPKTAELEELGSGASWPIEGLPHVIHLDNGKEFHGQALERGCREHGIALRFRPPRTPHFGGHVERLIGTLMGDVHLLPGTTFSSVKDRGHYPSEGRAALTMRELKRWLTLQIFQIYHGRAHRAIGSSPLAAWISAQSQAAIEIRRPRDPAKFYIDFLPGEHRLIRRDGICLWGIHYWESVLSTIAGRSTQKFLIRYDPSDLSHVFVKMPGEARYVKVPYRNVGRPPISLAEHRAVLKKLKTSKLSVDENSIFAAIDVQRSLVESACKDSAAARRLRAKSSALKKPSKMVHATSTESEDESPTRVEPYTVEVWE
jgi:putative transposase